MQSADRRTHERKRRRGGPQVGRRAVLVLAICAVAFAGSAEPLRLAERRARPVHVAIEISPPDLPARLDHHYSERGVAWFEPGPGPDQATVRIDGAELERMLASSDPVPGSFGDYVWVFDVATGHVLSASVTGAFLQRLDWGLMRTRVRADVSARMTTLEPAGFRAPRTWLGHVLFEHCAGLEAGCNTVPPRALDPATGYVNAVGKITAVVAGGFHTDTYSPLGEAVFTEMRSDTAVSAAAR